jgi:hypothetical protein
MAKTRESSLPKTQPRIAKSHPTQEQIAVRAYQLYLERGGTPGNALEDWIQAERQLIGDNGKPRLKAKAKSAAA